MARSLAVQALATIGKNWSKSSLTREATIQQTRAFAQFVQERFGLENIQNLKPGHVQAYVSDMRGHALNAGTMANRLSAIRSLAESIGKANIVHRTNAEYGIERVRKNPVESNQDKIAEIKERIEAAARNGNQIAMMCSASAALRDAFGLRAKESLMSHRVEDNRLIVEGSKGGRPRSLEIANNDQIRAVQYANLISQALESGTGRIIPPNMSLKQAYDAQKNLWSQLGGSKENKSHQHASRHYFAQQCKGAGDSDAEIGEKLGHGREDVVGHYVP